LVGRKIEKEFDVGVFEGKITGYVKPYFIIEYDDDDGGEATYLEALRLVWNSEVRNKTARLEIKKRLEKSFNRI
jgi:hypothetical protein